MKKSFLRSQKLLFALFVAFACILTVQAQVSGIITDFATGEPLIGATVQIQGSTTGTIADFDGNYTINASEGDQLVFSYVGYLSQTVTIGAQSSINVTLKEDIQELEKIVIVGYTAVKKSDLTGAVSSVSSKELNKVPTTSVASALQGRAAGVMITQRSGSPGAGSSVRIRGTGSVNGSDPLYVVDGVPIEGSPNLRPEDIESIEVLKDASATGIFGNRGANGVIVITSKRGGASAKPKVNFSYYTGFNVVPSKFDVMNSDEYVGFVNDMYTADGIAPDKRPKAYGDSLRNANGNVDTDWQDEISRIGRINSYSLSISGGSETSNFSIGGNYYKETGILIGTDLERFNFRANSDYKISDKLKIGESINVSRSNLRKVAGASWGVAPVASPLMPVYDELNLGGYAGPHEAYTGSNDKTNPVGELLMNEEYERTTRILGNMYVSYEIIKGLSYEFRIGTDAKFGDNSSWHPAYELGFQGEGASRDQNPSTLNRSADFDYLYNINNLIRYNKTFGEHDFKFLLGHEASGRHLTGFGVVGTTFDDPTKNVMTQATIIESGSGNITDTRLLSYFARLDYDYMSKYFLTVNFRNDKSSRFKSDLNSGNFPSLSAGWKFSEEDFMQNLTWLSSAKLRFGWGKTGNESVVLPYSYVANLDPFKNSRYVFGEDQSLYLGGMILASFVNEGITWENTETATLGTDWSLLDNKVMVTADLYQRRTNQMLVRVPLSHMSGRLPNLTPYQNIGEVMNKGAELSLSYRKYEGAFNYSVTGNFTYNKNEITKYAGYLDKNKTRIEEGMPIGSYYGFIVEGIFQNDDEIALAPKQDLKTSPGDFKYKDINGDGQINDNDRTYIGKKDPDFIFGFNLEASYKGFDFNAFLQGMYGFYIYNRLRQTLILPNEGASGQGLDENRLVDALDNWTVNNSSDIPRISKGDPNQDATRTSNYHLWFERGDFTRLKDIQLGYTFPKDLVGKINIANMRIYASGQNLFTLTKYNGYDPELDPKDPADGKVDNGTYPLAKAYIFGIQLEF